MHLDQKGAERAKTMFNIFKGVCNGCGCLAVLFIFGILLVLAGIGSIVSR